MGLRMGLRTLVITQTDFPRLTQLLASGFARAIAPHEYLEALRDELHRASIVPPDKVPEGTVTMNSTVQLRDLDTGELETYTLVYPHKANIAEHRLSVLAPVGTAILGYSVGDIVRWRVPDGIRRLRIEHVLDQPERTGAFRT